MLRMDDNKTSCKKIRSKIRASCLEDKDSNIKIQISLQSCELSENLSVINDLRKRGGS